MNDKIKSRQDLTRRERNKLKRRRNKIIALSLLACWLLFLTGVKITYDEMVGILGLPKESSIFSFGDRGQALRDLTDEISVCPVQGLTGNIRLLARRLFEWMYDLFSTLPVSRLSFRFPLDWQIQNKV